MNRWGTWLGRVLLAMAAGGALAGPVQAQEVLPRGKAKEVRSGLDRADASAGDAYYELSAVEAGPGDVIQVTMSSADFAPLVALYGVTSGRRVASAHGAQDASLSFTVTAGDVYVLGLSSREPRRTGAYSLKITSRPSPDFAAVTRLNAEVLARDNAIKARNEAAEAKYKAEQAKFEQAQAKYRAERASYEAQAKAAADARAKYERDKADWQAKVAACKAGDREACAS